MTCDGQGPVLERVHVARKVRVHLVLLQNRLRAATTSARETSTRLSGHIGNCKRSHPQFPLHIVIDVLGLRAHHRMMAHNLRNGGKHTKSGAQRSPKFADNPPASSAICCARACDPSTPAARPTARQSVRAPGASNATNDEVGEGNAREEEEQTLSCASSSAMVGVSGSVT